MQMLKTYRLILCSLLVLAFVASESAFALGGGGRGGGGGGGRGGGGRMNGGGNNGFNNGNDGENPRDNGKQMNWDSSTSDSLTDAVTSKTPVMLVVYRSNSDADVKALEKMTSWPQLVQLSKNILHAVKVKKDSKQGEELFKKFRMQFLPALVWLDPYGNAVNSQPMPDTAEPIVSYVQAWPATLAKIEAFFKDHDDRGTRLLDKGRFREAYLEFGLISSMKGPAADHARELRRKIENSWIEMLKLVVEMPKGSREAKAIADGVKRDTVALEVTAKFEKLIKAALEGDKTAFGTIDVAVADAAPKAAGAPVEKAGEMVTPKKIDDVGEFGGGDNKNLGEALTARAPVNNASNETETINIALLNGRTDAKSQEAKKNLEEALENYKTALADSMPRGPERNKLLKDAYSKFSKAIDALEPMVGTGPKMDTALDKLLQQASMLMYGSLKYQSL